MARRTDPPIPIIAPAPSSPFRPLGNREFKAPFPSRSEVAQSAIATVWSSPPGRPMTSPSRATRRSAPACRSSGVCATEAGSRAGPGCRAAPWASAAARCGHRRSGAGQRGRAALQDGRLDRAHEDRQETTDDLWRRCHLTCWGTDNTHWRRWTRGNTSSTRSRGWCGPPCPTTWWPGGASGKR
jgi:hypothetical protein